MLGKVSSHRLVSYPRSGSLLIPLLYKNQGEAAVLWAFMAFARNFHYLYLSYPSYSLPGAHLLKNGSWCVRLFSITLLHGQTHSDFSRFHFCLQKAHLCWRHVCFWTPRLFPFHLSSFKSTCDVKCMCMKNHCFKSLVEDMVSIY